MTARFCGTRYHAGAWERVVQSIAGSHAPAWERGDSTALCWFPRSRVGTVAVPLLNNALVNHGICHFAETGNVGTQHQVVGLAKFLGGF